MYSADRARLTSASDDSHSANVTKEQAHTKLYIHKESDPPCTIPHLPTVAAVGQAAVSKSCSQRWYIDRRRYDIKMYVCVYI